MSLIPEATIRSILDKTDIVAVIGERVRLEKKGNRWLGLCPFHGEKTASFNVDPDKGFFYCFGCRKGGDVVTFLREIDKLSYREAIEELAEKAGVPLEEEEGSSSRDELDRKALFELNDRMSTTFRFLLAEHPSGAEARAYLERRGIPGKVAADFRLGYAPRDRRWLFGFLKKKGYSPEFLARSGLFAANHPDFPLFADRLIFPIADQRGRVIAFGGRLLGGEGPKYINSPDTSLFRKQDNLFALDRALAAIKEKGEALVCEGYMDALSWHAAGIESAVAPLGTAFTAGQAKLLKRWAKSLRFGFDSDSAGLRAAEKACVLAASVGLEARITLAPGGKDASEILEKEGAGSLQKLDNFTINGGDFLVRRARELFEIGTVEGKAEAAAVLFPYIEALDSEVKRDTFLRDASRALGTDPVSLRSDFERAVSRGPKRTPPTERDTPAGDGEAPRRTPDLVFMIAVVINAEQYPRVRAAISVDDLEDSRARDLFIALEEAFRVEEKTLDAVLARIGDQALREYVLGCAARGEFSENAARHAEDGIRRVRLLGLERKRARIREKIASLGASDEGLADLQYEMMHLDAELARMKGVRDDRS